MPRGAESWGGMRRTHLLLALLLVIPAETTSGKQNSASPPPNPTPDDKSPRSAALRKEHPGDPTAWFAVVNEYFRSGDKRGAASLLHDASVQFPHQPDLAFNQAYVEYELGEHRAAISILERLTGLGSGPIPRPGREGPGAAARMENKWVDLLVKAYVKAGEVARGVALTDLQLARINATSDPMVHARVALSVYPWRHGSASWRRLKVHYRDLVQAARTTLSLPPEEVESNRLRMTPHNSLIFLPNALGSSVVRRHVQATHPLEPLNGTLPPPPPPPGAPPPPGRGGGGGGGGGGVRVGYLLWEVVETDVLYTVFAGILEALAASPGGDVVVYTLTRRPPPPGLRAPAGGRVRFVSFSRTEGWRAARRIREDGVEVLFDLTTYGDFTGAHILRHLPAPIQVGYLGYPGPKLAPFVNCSAWDRRTLPPEMVLRPVWGGERVVYLPRNSLPSSMAQLFGPVPAFEGGGACAEAGAEARREAGVPGGARVLCNFVQTWKIDPAVWGVWMDALMEGPLMGAHLLLWEQSADTRVNLGREAAKRHEDAASRVRFLPKVEGFAPFHRRLCACDLFLDTPYYNAGSTTASVLWAGVPILTLAGNRTASRLAAGHVLGGAPGLGALTVARTLEDYARLMVVLGGGGGGWEAARRALEGERGSGGGVFDTAKQAEDLERAARVLARLGGVEEGGASRFHVVLS